LTASYWPIPAGCVVLAVVLATALGRLDQELERTGGGLAFTGGPDSARSLLSTIAASMLSLTALVFSITIVVLQLTSSQFSPRALRTFLRDRQSQLTLGAFLASYVYSLTALREVRGKDGVADLFVPGVTITVAFVLVMVSVGLFVAYIHHIAQSIRVGTIIKRIADETRETIERVHPDEQPAEVSPPCFTPPIRVVVTKEAGIVTSSETDRLVALAARAGAVVRLVPFVGDFVATGMPLFEVSGGEGLDDDQLRAAVELGRERDSRQDVGFGLRQLVDIAERALSPGTNDPSTAVQCLDQIHDLLRCLVARPYPPSGHEDENGVVRLVAPTPSFDLHVALSVDEIRLWGDGSLQVRTRLQGLFDDLLSVAEGSRRLPFLDRLPLWDEPLRKLI
jgi:uncharacterized membrane protein